MNRIPTTHSCRLAVLLALLAATITPATLAPQASAGELTVFGCHAPNGAAVGHDGWTGSSTGQNGIGYKDTCTNSSQGDMSLEVGTFGYPDLARAEWTFLTPEWATIANYTIQIADSYTLPYAGAGEGQVFIHASDESNQVYDYRKLSAGSQSATLIERTPTAAVTELSMNASCDGEAGACPAGKQVSHLDISSTRVVLTDGTLPTVSNIGGPLVSPTALRGDSEITFDAADDGPGIYAAHLDIDGQAQPSTILNTNNGWCENLGQTTDGTRAFAHPTPCLKELSSNLTLDTSQLTDGTHNAKLIVEDASGNSTTGWSGTIVTDNAPVDSAVPVIEASDPQTAIGTQLSATNGAWEAPTGAGTIGYSGQWMRCNAEGNDCQPMSGANAPSYTVTSADVGDTLRYQVTAKNNAGSAVAVSPASVVVPSTQQNSAPPGPGGPLPGPGLSGPGGTGPGGSQILAQTLGAANGSNASEAAYSSLGVKSTINSSYNKSHLTVRGRLLDPEGQPIADATLEVLQQVAITGAPMRKLGAVHTARDGSFTAHIPKGPSRLIRLAYRAFANETTYAFTRDIVQHVSTGLTLQVTPTRITPHEEIALTGRVLGGYLGRLHPIVELQVKYLGGWRVFQTVRCKGHGAFKTTYKFLGATGLFPFRARVRASTGRPYTLGYSPTHALRAE